MSARVNEQASRVEVGDESYPFQIDCRSGMVAIDFDGVRFALRAHSWREKRMLARFSHLGDDFVRNQSVQLSLAQDSVLPDDARQREALSALCRWVNRTADGEGLPLNAQMLAAVTLQVSRALHAPPGSFDGLDASEVELLWLAAREETPPADADDDASNADTNASQTNQLNRDESRVSPTTREPGLQPGARRIVIVPDHKPTASPGSSRDGETPADSASPRLAADDGASLQTLQADAAQAIAPTTQATAGGPVVADSSLNPPHQKTSSRIGRQSRSYHERTNGSASQGERFRVILTGQTADASQPAQNALRQLKPEPAFIPQQEVATKERAHLQSDPVPLRMGSGDSREDTVQKSMPAVRRITVGSGNVESPASGMEHERRVYQPSVDSALMPAMADALFEELATRIEQAASELGIDMEN